MSDQANGHYFRSSDDLNIFYRDFGGQNDGTPVICLPGLTRNSRDFEDVAARLCDRRRVLTIDFRGRGFSEHDKNWRNYQPNTYVADVCTLLDNLNIPQVIVIGTSLGGLCAMLMAATHPARLAGVVMNDIGPEINPAGLARIQEYTGRLGPVTSWQHALQQTRDIYGEWLPGLDDDAFMRLARRAYRANDDGVPVLDIDVNIGRAVREVGPQSGDPWQYFAALKRIPTTLLWGEMSDILTADIVAKMQAAKPDLVVVPVPHRGHVPLLDEPQCVAAIDQFLEVVS